MTPGAVNNGAQAPRRIDTHELRARADLVEIVGRYVKLKRSGSEYEGLCPFHDERTPSFTVHPGKGFVHCFGCGAHYDVIGFLMEKTGRSFVEVCEDLGSGTLAPGKPTKSRSRAPANDSPWISLRRPPVDAPPLIAIDGKAAIWNPKRNRAWVCEPSQVYEYRDAEGGLLGYVLRIDVAEGRKITPQVTWCIGPDGTEQWCLRPFPERRPLFGLDRLAEKPDAPVLVVEGEKCALAGAGALPPYAVIAWPGGSKGIKRVDWSPLLGRDVVLWPDADDAGRQAMVGYEDYTGRLHDGIAQLAWRAGARSLRLVDPDGQPKGWDIADALQIDGWTAKQLAAWAASRVVDIEVEFDPQRRAA